MRWGAGTQLLAFSDLGQPAAVALLAREMSGDEGVHKLCGLRLDLERPDVMVLGYFELVHG
jgi:hypothetical protein